MRTPRFGRPSLVTVALAALAALLATTGLSGAANAANLVTLDIVSVTGTSAPAGTPPGAIPPVIVQVGQPVQVVINFYDSTGAPTSFSGRTTLVVSSSVGDSATANVPAGAQSVTIPLTVGTAANQVSVSVNGVGGDARKVVPDTWGTTIDVQQLVDYRATKQTSFQEGIGGKANDCGEVTASKPICGLLVLPNGAGGTQLLLSLGACDGPTSSYAPCDTKGSIVQFLADLAGSATPYSITSPATLIFKCDKTLCGTGSIQSKQILYSFAGSGGIGTVAGQCPAKNTMATPGQMCIDYVQTKRDNAGDTNFFLLTDRDARIITTH